MVETGNKVGRRILAIDGGGIKGVLPAAFLAAIEDVTGKRIVDHFDLIAGTSTGGIIALGLGLGLPAADILSFYRERGPSVFGWPESRPARWLRNTCWIARPKFSPNALRDALTDVFGARRLGESATRLVIPAFHRDQQAVYVFKTAHHSRFAMDYRESAVDVALATAAAPAYFPAHRLPSGSDLLDGGVWANNPTGLAVVEAVGVLGWSGHDLKVLSLGCTEEPMIFREHLGLFGLGRLGRDAISLFFQGQSLASLGTAKILTGHPHQGHRLWRYSPNVPRGTFKMDGVEQIERLAGLGEAEARTALPIIQQEFMTEPRAPFTPHHAVQ
tara:strand:- start:920 stop:1909 length:990 start_codon:yes stop_codon:yes gene_type:complete